MERYAFCNVGLALLHETTDITFFDAPEFSSHASETNLGAYFGVGAVLPMPWVNLVASWDSALFPAGSGGLFLAFGRRQVMSVGAVYGF